MLDDGQVQGKNGPILLPKLDGFDGERSISNSAAGSEWVYGSEEFAWEWHIDRYLEKLAPYIVQIARLTGARQAIGLIHAVRNHRDNEQRHNRLEAAKAFAKQVPVWLQVKRAVRKDRIYLDFDHYEPGVAWVWLGTEFTGVCIALVDGKVWLGEGDGYHRSGEHGAEEGSTWTDGDDGSVHTVKGYDPSNEIEVRDTVYCEAIRKLSIGHEHPEWLPCDERYWRRYCRIKKYLEKKLPDAAQMRSEAARKAWRTRRKKES